jgi:transcriptional regulator with XRE-family HTH domain
MKLAKYLELKGITQQEFADKLGCAQGYISKLVRGRAWPSREAIEAIADVTKKKVMANDFMFPDE